MTGVGMTGVGGQDDGCREPGAGSPDDRCRKSG